MLGRRAVPPFCARAQARALHDTLVGAPQPPQRPLTPKRGANPDWKKSEWKKVSSSSYGAMRWDAVASGSPYTIRLQEMWKTWSRCQGLLQEMVTMYALLSTQRFLSLVVACIGTDNMGNEVSSSNGRNSDKQCKVRPVMSLRVGGAFSVVQARLTFVG